MIQRTLLRSPPYGPARGRPGRGSSPRRLWATGHGAPRSTIIAERVVVGAARRLAGVVLVDSQGGYDGEPSQHVARCGAERSAAIERRRMTPTFSHHSSFGSLGGKRGRRFRLLEISLARSAQRASRPRSTKRGQQSGTGKQRTHPKRIWNQKRIWR